MLLENLIFSLFSILSIVFSLFVVISKNPIHSILSLILVFFNAASLLIFLGAEFLAMLFIIVYVGAVAVLFLFVIMMLNIKISSFSVSMYRYLPMFILFGLIFFSELFLILFIDLVSIDSYNLTLLNYEVLSFNFLRLWELQLNSYNNIVVLGSLLYTYYFYLFVVSGIILLVSMIGAISLTLHRRNDIKKQYIYKQIKTSFPARITLLSGKN